MLHGTHAQAVLSENTVRERLSLRENQRMSMRDLEVMSSIDPITTTSTEFERQR